MSFYGGGSGGGGSGGGGGNEKLSLPEWLYHSIDAFSPSYNVSDRREYEFADLDGVLGCFLHAYPELRNGCHLGGVPLQGGMGKGDRCDLRLFRFLWFVLSMLPPDWRDMDRNPEDSLQAVLMVIRDPDAEDENDPKALLGYYFFVRCNNKIEPVPAPARAGRPAQQQQQQLGEEDAEPATREVSLAEKLAANIHLYMKFAKFDESTATFWETGNSNSKRKKMSRPVLSFEGTLPGAMIDSTYSPATEITSLDHLAQVAAAAGQPRSVYYKTSMFNASDAIRCFSSTNAMYQCQNALRKMGHPNHPVLDFLRNLGTGASSGSPLLQVPCQMENDAFRMYDASVFLRDNSTAFSIEFPAGTYEPIPAIKLLEYRNALGQCQPSWGLPAHWVTREDLIYAACHGDLYRPLPPEACSDEWQEHYLDGKKITPSKRFPKKCLEAIIGSQTTDFTENYRNDDLLAQAPYSPADIATAVDEVLTITIGSPTTPEGITSSFELIRKNISHVITQVKEGDPQCFFMPAWQDAHSGDGDPTKIDYFSWILEVMHVYSSVEGTATSVMCDIFSTFAALWRGEQISGNKMLLGPPQCGKSVCLAETAKFSKNVACTQLSLGAASRYAEFHQGQPLVTYELMEDFRKKQDTDVRVQGNPKVSAVLGLIDNSIGSHHALAAKEDGTGYTMDTSTGAAKRPQTTNIVAVNEIHSSAPRGPGTKLKLGIDGAFLSRFDIIDFFLETGYGSTKGNVGDRMGVGMGAFVAMGALARLMGVFMLTRHFPEVQSDIFKTETYFCEALKRAGCPCNIRPDPRRSDRIKSVVAGGHVAIRACMQATLDFFEDKSAEELLTTFEERPFATVACILTRATQYHVPTFAEFFFEMTREWRKDFFNRTALDAVAVARYRLYENPPSTCIDAVPGENYEGVYMKMNFPGEEDGVEMVERVTGRTYTLKQLQAAVCDMFGVQRGGKDIYEETRNRKHHVHVDILKWAMTRLDRAALRAVRSITHEVGISVEIGHALSQLFPASAVNPPEEKQNRFGDAFLRIEDQATTYMALRSLLALCRDAEHEHADSVAAATEDLTVHISLDNLFLDIRAREVLISSATSILPFLPTDLGDVHMLVDEHTMQATFQLSDWPELRRKLRVRQPSIEQNRISALIVTSLENYPVCVKTNLPGWHACMQAVPDVLKKDIMFQHAGPHTLHLCPEHTACWPETTKRLLSDDLELYIPWHRIREQLQNYPELCTARLPDAFAVFRRLNQIPVQFQRTFAVPLHANHFRESSGILLKGYGTIESLRRAEEGPVGQVLKNVKAMGPKQWITTGIYQDEKFLKMWYNPEEGTETPSWKKRGGNGTVFTYAYSFSEEAQNREQMFA